MRVFSARASASLALSLLLGCEPATVRDAGARDARGSDVSIDAVVEALDVPSLDAPSSDGREPVDAVGDAGALPPLSDLAIGPYRSTLPMLLLSIDSNAASLDTSTTYGHSAAQGYLLQAIGELLSYARGFELPERAHLIDVALGEIAELEAAADRTTGPAPAFGLEDAWDAFGDGSVNPAFTAYTWQSGMVALGVAKIARVLLEAGHPEAARVRDFGLALVSRWDANYTSVALPDGTRGGYFWYSSQASDAIAVHNTSALIAMASQLLAESSGRSDPRAQAVVDLLWARMAGDPTSGYRWNYCDDGYPVGSRRAEDVSHALVTLQLMRFARERGFWTASQMQGVAATLLGTMWTGNPARLTGLVDGTRSSEEWSWTQAAVIGYAAHGDAAGGDPEVFDAARSILFSSYLSRYERPLSVGVLDAARTLALSMLFTHRPTAFATGSRWEMEAGPGDDAVPTAPGGVRFYTVDWGAPAPRTAGLTLPARVASAASANLLVDLPEGFSGRVIVSLTYESATDTSLAEWDGSAYHVRTPLPGTRHDDGTLRWFRTTLELDPAIRFDYQPAVPGTNVLLQIAASGVAVSRIEATSL